MKLHFRRLARPVLSPARQAEAKRRRIESVVIATLAFTAWMAIPQTAWAETSFSFPVLDDMMCGFIAYAKSKLAPYIAVLAIIVGVIGHWLGATKVWGLLLYVILGLGIIMGIGAAVVQATGSGASCL
jgi:hypothetical protein